MSYTKYPAIPDIPDNISDDHRRFFEAIKEYLEVATNRRASSNVGDRLVTNQDLVDYGLITTGDME